MAIIHNNAKNASTAQTGNVSLSTESHGGSLSGGFTADLRQLSSDDSISRTITYTMENLGISSIGGRSLSPDKVDTDNLIAMAIESYDPQEAGDRLNSIMPDADERSTAEHVTDVRDAAASLADLFHDSDNPIRSLSTRTKESERQSNILANATPGSAAIGAAELGVSSDNLADEKTLSLAVEHYNSDAINQSALFSVVYTLSAVRQNAFAEAFFRTQTCAANVTNIHIAVNLIGVHENYTHPLNGASAYQFNAKNIMVALVYPKILHNETNEMIPQYRESSNPAEDTTRFFVNKSKIAPFIHTKEDGTKIKTNYLAMGAPEEMSFTALATDLASVRGGAPNFTDTIDPSVRLEEYLLEFGESSARKIIRFANLSGMPESMFIYAQGGPDDNMNLNYYSRFVTLTRSTTLFDKSPLDSVIATHNLIVTLAVNITGSINISTGHLTMSSAKPVIIDVMDANGSKLPLTEGLGQQVVNLLKDMQIIGYQLKAKHGNLNHRWRGQVIDSFKHNLYYTIPMLAPLSAVRPTHDRTNNGSASESERIKQLMIAGYIRASNDAVDALLTNIERLRNLPPSHNAEYLYNNNTLGAGRFFIQPWYRPINLDVKAVVQSLRSSGRVEDVQAVLLNVIRAEISKAYLESNYSASASVLNTGNRKPKVIIGTDNVIASYLQILGDTRLLGDEFDFQVVSTPNIKMRGRIIVTFGYNGGDVNNFLYHGTFYWRPEFVTVLPVARDGTMSTEIVSMPSWLHVAQLPLYVDITVRNFYEAISDTVGIKTTTI